MRNLQGTPLSWRAAVAGLGVLAVAACGGDDNNNNNQVTMQDYIVAAAATSTGPSARVAATPGRAVAKRRWSAARRSVATDAGVFAAPPVTGVFHDGEPPAAGSGPSVQVSGTGIVINGGSGQFGLSASGAFTRVIVSLAGVPGYYEITLPAEAAAALLSLTLAQQPPANTFSLQTQVGTSASVGAVAAQAVSVTTVGTGDVQVSVSWDVDSDVDLYVADPAQDTVFFGRDSVASGGRLDLDSNPACQLDHRRQENITWPSGQAPSGQYLVFVNLYADCDQQRSNYTVTVQRKGHDPETFSGTLNAPGNGGETLIPITQFTQ